MPYHKRYYTDEVLWLRNPPIHDSHSMGEWYSDIRTMSSTPRFWSIRDCERCKYEHGVHVAGEWIHAGLLHKCDEVDVANKLSLTIGHLIQLLESIKEKHGHNAIVEIRVDDYGVIVRDVVTNRIVYDADTLVEFVYRFMG